MTATTDRAALGRDGDALPTVGEFCGAQNELQYSLRCVGDLVICGNRCNIASSELIGHGGNAIEDSIGVGAGHCDAAGVQCFGTLEGVADRDCRETEH